MPACLHGVGVIGVDVTRRAISFAAVFLLVAADDPLVDEVRLVQGLVVLIMVPQHLEALLVPVGEKCFPVLKQGIPGSSPTAECPLLGVPRGRVAFGMVFPCGGGVALEPIHADHLDLVLERRGPALDNIEKTCGLVGYINDDCHILPVVPVGPMTLTDIVEDLVLSPAPACCIVSIRCPRLGSTPFTDIRSMARQCRIHRLTR